MVSFLASIQIACEAPGGITRKSARDESTTRKCNEGIVPETKVDLRNKEEAL
jgi:hypothetical protein